MQTSTNIIRVPKLRKGLNWIVPFRKKTKKPKFLLVNLNEVKVNQCHYRPDVPRGFQEVKVPRLRDNGPGWW